MSKRTAQGPHGDKDVGIDFNMSSMPDDKPQRATAAQMANRKIKAINRRTRPSSPATSTSAQQPFSPFTSLDPNTVSSTSGGSQPPSVSNGFTFGQSQSFPGASSNPASNGTQPVSFGAGGGGSGFNFSSSFDTGPSVSNPFANMNGGGSSQGPGGSFGGFKGSIFNLPPASQTQNQQPATSSGLFGAQPQQNGTGSIFGGFGNNASTTTASPFQSTASTAPSTGGLFGQSSSQTTTAPSSSLFGQTNADKPTIFGNSTAFSAPSDSMQTSPDSKAGAGKPLFGTGATSQPPPTFGSLGSSGTKPLFGATSENKTPFSQASPSPFGAKPAEASASTATGGSIFGMTPKPDSSATATTSVPATTSAAPTPSLFGTNASTTTSAPTFQPSQPSSSLFSGPSKPAASQPASGSSGLFSFGNPAEKKTEEPKTPATDAAAESKKDDSASKTPGGLFGSTSSFGQPPASNIFAPKASSTAEQTPAQTAPANPFAGLFSMNSPAQATSSQEKPQTSPFQSGNAFSKPEATAGDSAPAPKRPSLFPTGPSTSSATTSTGPFSFKGAASTTTTSANTSTSKVDSAVSNDSVTSSKVSFGTKGPRSLPPNLSKELRDDVDLLHRVRTLNECFKRKISELDASKDDFDVVILFYMRVRETLGAPVGESRSTASKRKTRDVEDTETALQKKARSAEQSTDQPATNIFSTSPFKPAASSDFAASNKRKSADDADASPQPEKRPSTSQAAGSTTASLFASSFSGSQDAKTTADKAPETSTAAPAFKPVFPPSSTSTVSSSQNTFSPKPSTEKATETPAKPVFQVPKFGSGAAPNFLSQFKQQADKDAEKEKAKRKAEDFDSDEDDEAEWERKDAEERRKKLEEFEALSKKRAKFVPGKGFIFDDGTDEESAQSSEKAAAPAFPQTSSSVFQKTGNHSPPKAGNIFGHLSGTNSEAEGGDDDSDKESVNGDVSNVAGLKALPAPPTEGSADSSDEGDISKALKKKSEESAAAKKDVSSASTPQSGRSLFDRIQYNDDGKPKREGQPLEEKKDQGNNVSTLFGNTKFASSVNASSSGSPSIFSTSAPGTPKAGSIFGSSLNTGGGLFGSPTPAAANAAGSTASSFGDYTWKKDSSIKFSDGAADSSSGTTTAGDSKSLSTLFGGSIAQKPSGNSTGAPQLGFAFGSPSQGTSSIFSSAGVSATPSGTTTPAATSDTGAEDSADGDAAPSEPQVDLARSRAGEEDEDMLIEIRARALKMESGSGWQSQGVGWLRVLKHKTTSRSRVILRADPSGKVVLNASLLPQIKYKESGTSVQFLIPKAEGAPEQWAIRVKKEEVSRLASTMEEAKA
ncbi:hypothetical protein Plec18167_006433 [Paecilomyces lecythidis]|uniref:RanBD1 domain-containing protein n=1 Tax=Paecilomyces lecythidis TaxID=3004212 RepID=A0ABR3XCF7_9EURO